MPPVLSLAERIKSGHFIIGAKNRYDLPLLERIQAIPNTEIIIMTEDGSLGNKGLATDVIGDVIRPFDDLLMQRRFSSYVFAEYPTNITTEALTHML